VNLNRFQQAAVDSKESRLVITAAAGSGKTRVLTERYLRYVVEDNLRPDEIIAITFTRRAAAEMKGRILTSLRARGLHEAASIAETGPIQTIDSFVDKLLREYSVFAGVDPKFENETEGQERLTRVLEEWMAEYEEHDPCINKVLDDQYTYYGYETRAIGQELERDVRTVMETARSLGWSLEHLRNLSFSPESYLQAFIDVWHESVPAEIQKDCERPTLESFSEYRLNIAKEIRGRKLALSPLWLDKKWVLEDELPRATQACGLLRLVAEVWKLLDQHMESNQTPDREKVMEILVRTFETQPQARTRIQNQCKVLLVDESQDISPLQNRLFEAMDIREQVFIGDGQQSIYGFRHADLDHFVKLGREWPKLPLPENKRTDAGVLSFIDSVFTYLWPEEYQAMSASSVDPDDPFALTSDVDFSGVDAWVGGGDVYAADIALQVVSEGTSPGEIAILTHKQSSVRQIRERLRELGIASLAIGRSDEFYVRMVAKDISNTLSALVSPDDTFAFLCMLASPFVGLSLDSVVLLSRQVVPGRDLKELALDNEEEHEKLQSCLEWFLPLSETADRLGAWEVLSATYARTSFLENLCLHEDARDALGHARYALEIAANHPEWSAREFSEHLRPLSKVEHRADERTDSTTETTCVKVGTFHSAKGLEFPTVIVPKVVIDPSGRSRVHVSRQHNLIAYLEGIPYATLKAEQIQRERAEAYRVLYVALTRAKHRLVVELETGGKKDSTASIMARAIGFRGESVRGLKIRT
jgi:ATP-dependent helicase/nuclease subunit A